MKKITIILFIVLVLLVGYWYTNKSQSSVQENCRAIAQSEYQQGIISGPDAIGNRMEQCLALHKIDPNI